MPAPRRTCSSGCAHSSAGFASVAVFLEHRVGLEFRGRDACAGPSLKAYVAPALLDGELRRERLPAVGQRIVEGARLPGVQRLDARAEIGLVVDVHGNRAVQMGIAPGEPLDPDEANAAEIGLL